MTMKTNLASAVAAFALVLSAHSADVTLTMSDVHICCDSCVKGAQKAVAGVKDLTAVVDKDDETIILTGTDKTAVQNGVDALVAAGFFGRSSDPSIKVNSETGAKNQKVELLHVEGVHLCCGSCVKAINTALESVSGVKANTAKKDATSFEVTGDFNDKEVFDALQKAGLTGKVAK
jgi:copper chaperone CopZ